MATDDDDDLKVVEGQVSDEDGETVVIDEDAAKKGGDERMAQSEDDEAIEGRTPEETEAIRAQRRIERRAKKQREHAARDSNRRELDFLRARNEKLERQFSQLEQRTFQSEFSQADKELATIENQLRQADSIISAGIKNQDGDSVTEAQNIKQDLIEAKRRLNAQKERVVAEAREAKEGQSEEGKNEQAQQQPRKDVDPELIAHANRWKAANAWYSADQTDEGNEDRAIASIVDTRLAQEGYDPATSEFWDELTSRLQKRMPHRFGKSNGRANGNGHGERPAMANGARERSLKPGEMYVSPERKAALIEAGAWDDPKLRQKYLKSFATYDAEAAVRNA